MIEFSQVRVAALLAMFSLISAPGVPSAKAQQPDQTDKVTQLEEIVATQQEKIDRLEARLVKLEEIARVLDFDRHAAAKQAQSKPGPVQPSGEPVTAQTELNVGSTVLVQWQDTWWNGSVLELLADGTVKIHYDGWDQEHDEVVARTRLLIPGPGARLTRQPPARAELSIAEAEVSEQYAAAHPEIQQYILWTAGSFGRNGMWLNEDAFASLTDQESEQMVQDLAALLEDGEYGRHLCTGLARAGALKDERLVPGLMKVAGYHRDDVDYDCRPKWMAVAALARQESDEAVPLLISLVDHGNQNTRKWARAALARKTGEDFQEDKPSWAAWWEEQGHPPVDEHLLEPYQPPTARR